MAIYRSVGIEDTLAQILQLRCLDSFLATYFVKRKDLIPNIILKLHQEYCESDQVSSPGKCPTHLPSHMGPFYFVAKVQGVPSVRRDTWTQLPFYFRLLIFFSLTRFLESPSGRSGDAQIVLTACRTELWSCY